MKKVLMGFVCDGTAGGVDKYITNFFQSVDTPDVKIDFLTNLNSDDFLKHAGALNSELFCVSGLGNPFKQYSQIKKILKDKYDVLYLNVSTALAFPAVLAAKSAKVKKIVVHSHSSGYDCESALKRRIMTLLHKICKVPLCLCATDFLSCSDKASGWMFTRKVIKNKRVQIIRNTADLSCFSYDESKRQKIRKELSVDGKFVIGFVGNMLYAKNPLFLADLLKCIVERRDDVVLVTIGDGPLSERLKEKISLYGLDKHFKFLGRRDSSDGYMSAFDVLVLPSNFEGMPLVSIEAQCSALPCVISKNVSQMAKISNMCDFVSIDNEVAFAEQVLKYRDVERSEHKITADLSAFSLREQKNMLRKVIE